MIDRKSSLHTTSGQWTQICWLNSVEMLTLCCSWTWGRSANTWHTAAGWAPHSRCQCILGHRVLEGQISQCHGPITAAEENSECRYSSISTSESDWTVACCKSRFEVWARGSDEDMTHRCTLQWGHYPSASRPIWFAHDAPGMAALQCHKSPETTPSVLLWHKSEKKKRDQDERSVPGGLHCLSAAVPDELQWIIAWCHKDEVCRPSSVKSLFWDEVSWISSVHSPAACSPQQWVVMNSHFWNPSVELSRGLDHNIT